MIGRYQENSEIERTVNYVAAEKREVLVDLCYSTTPKWEEAKHLLLLSSNVRRLGIRLLNRGTNTYMHVCVVSDNVC